MNEGNSAQLVSSVKHKTRSKVTEREKREVFRLLEDGKSIAFIARNTGISRTKLYDLKREFRKFLRMPHSPAQSAAYEKCKLHDHGFMKLFYELESEEEPEQNDLFEVGMIYGWVSINGEVLDDYDLLTPADRHEHPVQPRIFSVGEPKLVWGNKKEGTDQLFPLVGQVLTCWFCGEKKMKWWWVDLMDQMVGGMTEFQPSVEELIEHKLAKQGVKDSIQLPDQLVSNP